MSVNHVLGYLETITAIEILMQQVVDRQHRSIGRRGLCACVKAIGVGHNQITFPGAHLDEVLFGVVTQ